MTEEDLTPEQQQEFVANDILSEWLGECRYAAAMLVDIDDALALLARKRTTLEEKIIRKELHSLAAKYCSLLMAIHEHLRDSQQPPTAVLEEFRTFNFKVRSAITELLKALRYNFNYTEQYFEFGFAARMVEEYRFSEEAERLIEAMKK